MYHPWYRSLLCAATWALRGGSAVRRSNVVEMNHLLYQHLTRKHHHLGIRDIATIFWCCCTARSCAVQGWCVAGDESLLYPASDPEAPPLGFRDITTIQFLVLLYCQELCPGVGCHPCDGVIQFRQERGYQPPSSVIPRRRSCAVWRGDQESLCRLAMWCQESSCRLAMRCQESSRAVRSCAVREPFWRSHATRSRCGIRSL